MRMISNLVFIVLLAAVTVCDWKTMEIPDVLNLLLLGNGVAAGMFFQELSVGNRLCGMVSVSVPMLLLALAVPGAFGGGDIKLMAACGVFLGWKRNLIAAFLAVLVGGIYGIWLLVSGKKGRHEYFAFGPFLCLGMVIALFWGDGLWTWYLGVCGWEQGGLIRWI